MADKWKIAEEWMGVWVRKGPGTNYTKTHVIYGKDKKTYTVKDKIKNKYWVHLEGEGWVCDRDSNGMIVLKKIENAPKTVEKVELTQEEKLQELEEDTYAPIPEDIPIVVSEENFAYELSDHFTISSLRGIFGMPYQFMDTVDPLMDNSDIGRKYAQEIVSNMPLLLMTAGKPVFMGGYSQDDKKNILGNFLKAASGVDVSGINDMIFSKDFGKYYTLEYAYNEYFQYVNPMCRIAARVMGLHDEKIDGVKLDRYEWSQNVNSNFNKLFSVYKGCTAWYCDSETSIGDSFTNGTSESMLASGINSLSDKGRELNFLLGTVKTETGIALDRYTSAENLNQNMENTNDMINNLLGANNGLSGMFKSITNSAQTVAAGGKLVFPEIWSDSSFSRSYNVNLKFVSPDGDDLSIYLNIIVPMLHLLALTLPRETKSHGYMSPFLVRAFYKGFFNVDMGIISDLSFNKGKEGAWTSSGIPTVVEANFTIKDLYSDLYMSKIDGDTNMLKNIMLMDYISNMCGVNINEVDVYRAIDLWFTQNGLNRFTDTWRLKVFGNIDQAITNRWQRLFGRF